MNAFRADTRPLVALDWSTHGVHVTTDGTTVDRYPSVDAFLDTLVVPHRIAAESTFESWDRDRKQLLVRRLRTAGHELYVFRPLHTARARTRYEIKKSDTADTKVIYQLATEDRFHLYPLPAADPDWETFRVAANLAYLKLRTAGVKPELVKATTDVIGTYRSRDEHTQLVLGNGKTYAPSLLAAVCFASTVTRSRPEFERLLGLHGSGYPSLLRSDVHHHSFRWAANRGVCWTDFRRHVRRMRSTLVAARHAGELDIAWLDTSAVPSADAPRAVQLKLDIDEF